MPQGKLKTLDVRRAGRKTGRRGPCLFRQRDVQRLLRAAHNAGMLNASVDVHADGRLSLVPLPDKAGNDRNELDKWIADHANQTEGA